LFSLEQLLNSMASERPQTILAARIVIVDGMNLSFSDVLLHVGSDE
jgi:hypothetical protein